MRIWLVTVGEPLPTDEGVSRLHRTGILANLLAEKGHDVTWWTSSFDHFRKRQRIEHDTFQELSNGIELIILRGCGYQRNVSLSRIRDHQQVAGSFRRHATARPKPDVILCSYPTIELTVASTRYGKTHDVPVVIDIRDLWPDIFLDLVPNMVRSVARIGLLPMWLKAREACRNATAISASSPRFVEWGLTLAGRKKTDFDRYFPFGYVATAPSGLQVDTALAEWAKIDVHKDSNIFTVCFFGSLGRQFDLDSVIRSARILEERGIPTRFVICGAGERLNELRKIAKGVASVIMPGWVDAPHIWTLMRMSQAGIAPYLDNAGFSDNFPNKTIEYLSAGLPVVSSLHGYFEEFLRDSGTGVSYPARDPVALANTLAQLIGDKLALREMGTRAKSVFDDCFRAEKVYCEMINYLEEIVANFSAKSS